MIVPKSVMETYYFKDPKKGPIIRELNGAFTHYYYIESKITLHTNQNEVLNGCLVLGNADLSFKGENYLLNQFDFFISHQIMRLKSPLIITQTAKYVLSKIRLKRNLNLPSV
ncbi:MAG: hypothetical protein P8Y70_07030 [Candidatus Lokiarchaeota archaeon]